MSKAKGKSNGTGYVVPVYPPVPEDDDVLNYEPYLAEWQGPHIDPETMRGTNAWLIKERGSERLIATIAVGPHFTIEESRNIAIMMQSAPKLWRLLRKVGTEIHEWTCGGSALVVGEIAHTLNECVPMNTEVYVRREWDEQGDADTVKEMNVENLRIAKLYTGKKGGAA